ncbi:MAG: hypothetical protein AB7O97_14405 [Planctomycetota bacterium]
MARLQFLAGMLDLDPAFDLGPVPSYVDLGGERVPQVNVRIGFAFHRASERALEAGLDPDRIPQQVGTFLYDLNDPVRRAELRAFGATAVQWRVDFANPYRRTGAEDIGPAPVDLSVRRIWLPFRF